MTIKPSVELVRVINSLPVQFRREAMKVAEVVILRAFRTLEYWGDFDQSQNVQMAMDAAVAEVVYRYSKA